METKLYNERHTKAVLESERQVINKKNNEVKAENAQMAREISRNKMFNKRDEERKAKRHEQDKLHAQIKELSKKIEEHDIKLDQEKRKLDDRDLIKRQQQVVMQLNQEKNKVNIDISIAESRIKDLQGLKDLTLSQIEDILSEKRKMDKENADIDQKVQGKGLTETDLKLKQIDAEREMIKKIQNSLKNHKENANYAMDRLKDEETKAKDMLDEKIKQ